MPSVPAFGTALPAVQQIPTRVRPWEKDVDGPKTLDAARAAEAAGFAWLACSDHPAVPVSRAQAMGPTWFDAGSTLAFVAGVTTRIRLLPHVLVLPYRHPLLVAKQYGTLDFLSGGRVILGVGVGSLQPEFDLLGVPFADRGPRADDALRAIRVSLAEREPSYQGPYYRFGGMVIDPFAVQQHMPIWVGGRTRRSLRRGVELGDGWMPFGLGVGEMAAMIKSVDIPAGFDLALSPDRALDPGGSAERVLDTIGQMEVIGTTVINARIVGQSLDHYLEQLEALASVAGLAGGSR